MKTAELNDILEYEGKMVKVIGIAVGKMIIMEPIHLANQRRDPGVCIQNSPIYVLENSVNFQNGAKAIKTIKE